MKNLLITMSGGTTTVNNAILAGIIRASRSLNLFDKIFAGVPGISGVLAESLHPLHTIADTELDLLEHSPGSAFAGTTRISPLDEVTFAKLEAVLKKFKISHFVNIGGNGTIKQTIEIAKRIPALSVAAAPKTVDNDLGDAQFKDVFFTPGFPSCVHYWAQKLALLNNENFGACSHDKVLVAQTFGRETGFLAGAIRLADTARKLPLIILLPEDPQPIASVLHCIKEAVSNTGRALVVMSEGYPIGDLGAVHDATGQIMYGSSELVAAQLLVTHCIKEGIQARSFIPTIDQRQDPHSVTDLDRHHAVKLGQDIAKYFGDGKSNFYVSSGSSMIESEFQTSLLKLDTIKNFSRKMPPEWIASGMFDVTDAYVSYLQKLLPEYAARGASSYYNYRLIKPLGGSTDGTK